MAASLAKAAMAATGRNGTRTAKATTMMSPTAVAGTSAPALAAGTTPAAAGKTASAMSATASTTAADVTDGRHGGGNGRDGNGNGNGNVSDPADAQSDESATDPVG